MKLALLLAASSAAACSLLPKPEQSRFYVLSVVPPPPDPPASAGPWVGLGPIELPAYLARPQLVTRVGPSELALSETERWAEPLEDGFARILREDLGARLGAESVVLYPWPVDAAPPLALTVDVERFERLANPGVELLARWTLRNQKTGEVISTGERRIEEPLSDSSTEAAVASLSRAIGALAGELESAVRAAPRERRS